MHHGLMSVCPQSCLHPLAGWCSCPTRREDGSTQRSGWSLYCDGHSASELTGELMDRCRKTENCVYILQFTSIYLCPLSLVLLCTIVSSGLLWGTASALRGHWKITSSCAEASWTVSLILIWHEYKVHCLKKCLSVLTIIVNVSVSLFSK